MMVAGDSEDFSNGWEAVADEFIAVRNQHYGSHAIANWAEFLQPGQEVLDIGCGFGGSYTHGLIDQGIQIYGIDASQSLLAEHRKRYPEALVRCEAVQRSLLFEKEFSGIIAVGLVFLLDRDTQVSLLRRVALALKKGGRLLFSAPWQVCEWDDLLTNRKSQSLGREAYCSILEKQGLILHEEFSDEGENHFFDFHKE